VKLLIKLSVAFVQFTQECVYKYNSTQYNYGEEDREVNQLSADIYWHCESSKIINLFYSYDVVTALIK